MGRRIGLTLERRQMVVGMLTGGMRIRVVLRHFVVHERIIARLKSKYHQTGTIKNCPRSGRSQKTTPADNRSSSRRNQLLSNRHLAARLPGARGTRISNQTVRSRLHAGCCSGRRLWVYL